MKKQLLIAGVLSALTLTAIGVQAQDGRERPDFATLDANSDGSVTREELQAHRAANFAQRDLNGDGGLSIEELTADHAERAGERAARMLDRLDSNDDGVLQEAELTDRRGDRMERMFERVDADGNGSLSEEELEAAKGRRGGRGHRGRG